MWRFLKKLKIELPYDPAIPVLGIHTEETRIKRDTCTLMFISALFTIVRTWKQPRCPSADEWIRRQWYIYTMEYYSAIIIFINSNDSFILKGNITPMFIAALFIIARTWKQPRCPSADEWIRKLWYIYTMEYYSAIKRTKSRHLRQHGRT